MANYLFNTRTDSNGWHEIHKDTCTHLPSVLDRENIGTYYLDDSAKRAAMQLHPSYEFDGCYWCCPSINHG